MSNKSQVLIHLFQVNLIVASSQFDSLTFERLKLENGDDNTHESIQRLLAVAR
jgi:hypothetical protein